ncbi:glycosyltransferase family 4 protein [Desulfobulbus alkaliphilus]|uniref:glycosyltransferase family 4 protein n=1 Tax=Desulfobulbus alkaliphilus TaxID=869814 RepID=UPI001965B08A|nr:glycosyltransferase family 4 protein [Desulfobulbus alkaliphilus]MBM9538195.1 glycosyltransferase family 4 protein [Desulfobulbus alkaliphilus]
MRILHINTFDHAGGAARAAYWLHSGLRKAGHESLMLVQHKTGGEPAIVNKPGRSEMLLKDIRWLFDMLPLLVYRKRDLTHWTVGWPRNSLCGLINKLSPDIIHLHWICRGMMPIREIGRLFSLGPPVVWTFHDSWPFTGGCHVPGSCRQYKERCGNCPQLGSSSSLDLSRLTLAHKRRQWRKGTPVLVTPSQWLANCVQASSLFAHHRIVHLANGIDTDIFQPVEKHLARSILNIPETGKKLILCGAMNAYGDPNKGFHLFRESIKRLITLGWQQKVELLIFGESEPPPEHRLPLPTRYLGVLHDDVTLRLAYSAADLFIMPSLQENLPNSILESLACRTPVAAFAAGGIPELLQHSENGFLAQPFNVNDLAQGIIHLLSATPIPRLTDQFTQQYAVKEHQALYHEMLQQ